MDPIDHRHAEWQHALYGAPAPAARRGVIGPVIVFAAALVLPWVPAMFGVVA